MTREEEYFAKAVAYAKSSGGFEGILSALIKGPLDATTRDAVKEMVEKVNAMLESDLAAIQ